MKPTHIGIDAQGVFCVEVSEIECTVGSDFFERKEALEAAMKNRVYFKDEKLVRDLLWDTVFKFLNKEKLPSRGYELYPIPDGYEVKLESPDCDCPITDCVCVHRYSILVPKQDSRCKEYCNCAREAMKSGANRDWVDQTQDECPLKPKQEFKTVGAIDAGKFKNWADTGISHKVPKQEEPSGYQGYCPSCGQVVTTNMQGNILDGHKCVPKQPVKDDAVYLKGFYTKEQLSTFVNPKQEKPTSIEEDALKEKAYEYFAKDEATIIGSFIAGAKYQESNREFVFKLLNDFLTCYTNDGSSKKEAIENYLNSNPIFKQENK